MPDHDREPRVVQTARPLTTPLPMGFLGLMVASTLFGVLQLGWLGIGQSQLVALGALVFAVPLQACSAVFGVLGRDAAAGTGSGILAATWGATSAMTLARPHPTTHAALGVLLLLAGAALLVPAAGSLGKSVASLVLAAAALRFVVTGAYELTASHAWMTVAGWVGLVAGAVALYGALAFELEDVRDGPVLPTGRRTSVADEPPVGVRSEV